MKLSCLFSGRLRPLRFGFAVWMAIFFAAPMVDAGRPSAARPRLASLPAVVKFSVKPSLLNVEFAPEDLSFDFLGKINAELAASARITPLEEDYVALEARENDLETVDYGDPEVLRRFGDYIRTDFLLIIHIDDISFFRQVFLAGDDYQPKIIQTGRLLGSHQVFNVAHQRFMPKSSLEVSLDLDNLPLESAATLTPTEFKDILLRRAAAKVGEGVADLLTPTMVREVTANGDIILNHGTVEGMVDGKLYLVYPLDKVEELERRLAEDEGGIKPVAMIHVVKTGQNIATARVVSPAAGHTKIQPRFLCRKVDMDALRRELRRQDADKR